MFKTQQTSAALSAPPLVRLLLDPRRSQTETSKLLLNEPGDDDDNDAFRLPPSEPTASAKRPPFDTIKTLVDLVWRRTVLSLDCSRLDTECPIVAIVTPTESWAGLVGKMLALSSGNISIALLEKPRDGERLRSDYLPRMRPLVIVTHDVTMIPHMVTAGLDATITLSLMTVDIIAELIRQASKRRVTRTQLPRLKALLHLDPCDIAAIVRRGRSRDAILAAIDKLATPRNSGGAVPDLATSRSFAEAGVWGRQLADDLDAWKRGEISWNEVDRGCLLWGPPGTGKTLFAQSLANFCGVPLVVASVGQLFTTGDSHLGTVVKHLRKVFAEAGACTPSILFFDEIDALPSREALDANGRQWWSTVVTDFLTLLDGAIGDRAGVVVIAATNVVSAVDPALLRPGRLERKVFLGPPDANGLEDVLRHHLKGELADADVTELCQQAVGVTSADIMLVVRDARRAARTEKRPLDLLDLRSAFRISETLPPEIRWRAAVHEAGHALVSDQVGHSVERIVVGATGNSNGHVFSRRVAPLQGTRQEFLDGLRVLLGGRAAEEAILGAPSAGCGFAANSDLVQATTFAIQLEMSSGLGGLAIVPIDKVPDFIACSVDVRRSVEHLLGTLYNEVRALLEAEKDRLKVLAQAVYEQGKLDAVECARLLEHSV